jgi:DNA-binding transcriptional LysR family regulator
MAGRHLAEDCPCISLSEFREIPFILLSKGNNLYDRSLRMFREADFEPQTRMKLSQLVTAFRLAEAGIGATFVSDRLMTAPAKKLHFYKISSDISERQFYILLPKRKYVSVAARRFIEYFTSADAHIVRKMLQCD